MKQDLAPGDVVVIRDWDDMLSEYEREGEDIHIEDDGIYFAGAMKQLCGREVTIRDVGKSIRGRSRITFEEPTGPWKFSPGTVRLVHKVQDLDPDEFERLMYEGG